MNRKRTRLAVVRSLIETGAITSQEKLLDMLAERGVVVTQSTLSRDIKEIKAVKVPMHEQGYAYVMPSAVSAFEPTANATSMIAEAVLGVEFSGSMCVIKTRSGYANAIAIVIDAQNYQGIVGTLAGDDTIFIALRDEVPHNEIIDSLINIFPNINKS